MKISLSGKSKALSKLNSDLKLVLEKERFVKSKQLMNELKQETPVDTGEARDSWALTHGVVQTTITNSADHIQYLNQGSSKQAPAFFVEKAAIKYGTPLGAIVDLK